MALPHSKAARGAPRRLDHSPLSADLFAYSNLIRALPFRDGHPTAISWVCKGLRMKPTCVVEVALGQDGQDCD
jgi:hypothetical protein